MKKLLLLFLLPLFLQAQTFVRSFNTTADPVGGCINGYRAVNITTGTEFFCNNGTWAAASSTGTGDGGGGTEPLNINRILSGGGVVWTGTGLNFIVAAATYEIAGQRYNSIQTSLTLTAADATNPRFDLFILTDSGTATFITGTPAADPAVPSYDPTTQLSLTPVLIAALATTPSNILTENIYLEDAGTPDEWAATESDASHNCGSTSNPRTGTKDCEATTAARNDFVDFEDSGTHILSTYNNLLFYIRSKAAWPNNRCLTISWRLAEVAVGTGVILCSGDFNFNSSNTTDYQQIVVPVSQFGSIGTVDELRITVTGGGGGNTIGYYLDDIKLQGGFVSTLIPSHINIRSITYLGGCDSCAVLEDTDDQLTFWRNNITGLIISEVWCESDAGTPIINLQRDDGSAANILSSNLTCTTSGALGVISTAEDNVAIGDKLDFVMVTAGGVAKRVTVNIKMVAN